MDNMFSDLIPQQKAAEKDNMFADLIPQTDPSYLEDLGSDISNRMSNLKTDIAKGQTGQMNPLASGIAGTGELFGVGMDAANQGLKRIPGYQGVTSAIKSGVNKGAQAVADAIDSPMTENMATGVSDAASEFAKNHPDYMASVKGGANILGGLGLVEGATNGLNAMSENSRLTGAEPPLPGSPSVIPAPVNKAIFDPAKAHAAISENYGQALKETGADYNAMRGAARGKAVPKPDIADPLNEIISDIENPGSFHEAASALPKLKKIAKAFQDDGDTIPLEDVVALKKLMNTKFNSGRFMTGADSPYAQLGASLGGTLDQAAEAHPRFGALKRIADVNYVNKVVLPFQDNAVLKKLWKPEDYYAQKSLNSPANPKGLAYSLPDQTAKRADNLLNNINDQHSLEAVRRVLPEELAANLTKAKLQQLKSGNSVIGNLGKAAYNVGNAQVSSALGNLKNAVFPSYSAGDAALLKYLKKNPVAAKAVIPAINVPSEPVAPPAASFFDGSPEIDPNASMLASLSPEERLAAHANVLDYVSKKKTPIQSAKRSILQSLKVEPEESTVPPIRSFQELAPHNPSVLKSLASEEMNSVRDEMQQLRSMGVSEKDLSRMYPGYKKGGAVKKKEADTIKKDQSKNVYKFLSMGKRA